MSHQKTVFITGASSGIGKATAAHFAARGWNVAATMRTPEPLELSGGYGSRLRVFHLDVTEGASIEAAVRDILGAFQRIDVLVNNAGYGLLGAFEDMSADEIRRNLETNVLGVMNVTRAVLPAMRAQRSGRIVNVGSVAGRLTIPLYSIYCATKFAVDGFSEALDHEVRPFGIRVKIIEPGAVKTNFFGRSLVMPKPGKESPYSAYVARVFGNIKARCQDIPGPEIVAQSIWHAATDRNWRMRYAPNGRLMLLGRSLAPTVLHAAIVRRILDAN